MKHSSSPWRKAGKETPLPIRLESPVLLCLYIIYLLLYIIFLLLPFLLLAHEEIWKYFTQGKGLQEERGSVPCSCLPSGWLRGHPG